MASKTTARRSDSGERAIQISKINDGCEADRIETRAAYEKSVNLRLRHEDLRIVGFDAAAVQDAGVIRRVGSKIALHMGTDKPVSIRGDIG